jgi:hypothetical protein
MEARAGTGFFSIPRQGNGSAVGKGSHVAVTALAIVFVSIA